MVIADAIVAMRVCICSWMELLTMAVIFFVCSFASASCFLATTWARVGATEGKFAAVFQALEIRSSSTFLRCGQDLEQAAWFPLQLAQTRADDWHNLLS